MRNLFIAMGAPGTGKTTWLRSKGLEGNTVSLDKIREMASVPEECFPGDDPDAYGETHVTLEEHETLVTGIRDRLLTMRFRQGADVVYEATCPNMRAVGRVMKIARDYGHRNGVTTEGTTRDQWGRTRPAFRRLAVDGVPGVFNLEQGAGHTGGRVAAVVFGPGDKHWVLESD